MAKLRQHETEALLLITYMEDIEVSRRRQVSTVTDAAEELRAKSRQSAVDLRSFSAAATVVEGLCDASVLQSSLVDGG